MSGPGGIWNRRPKRWKSDGPNADEARVNGSAEPLTSRSCPGFTVMLVLVEVPPAGFPNRCRSASPIDFYVRHP